jgi:high-affinity K+ transport system ATPase subunit B
LSRGVQVASVIWQVVTMIVTGVGDLMQMIGDDRIGRVLGGRVIERSGDTVCDLHHARGHEEHEFLG